MGQFTHDGVVYEEMPDGNVRVVGYAPNQSPGMVVPPNPVLAARQAADDARKNAADRRDDIRTGVLVTNQDKPADGYRWVDPEHTRQEFIPGGLADPANKPKTAEQLSADQAKTQRVGRLQALINQINTVQSQYESGVGSTGGLMGLLDYVPTNANAAFDSAAASLAEQGLGAFRVPGVGSQSDLEAKQFADANKPTASDRDPAIEQKLNNLRNRVNTEMETLGLPPVQWEGKKGIPAPAAGSSPTGTGTGNGNGGSYKPDLSGNRTFLTERDKALAAEAQAAFESGGDRAQIDAIAAKYGLPAFGSDLDAAIDARRRGVKGTRFNPSPTGHEEAGLTSGVVGMLQGSAPGQWAGSYVTGAGNAATFGQLGNLLEMTGSSPGGTQVAMDMTRENAIPYLLGEITGSLAPTAGLARGLRAGSGLISNPAMRSALTNPIAADAAYGAAYGASSADDPLYGAIGGGGLAAGGSYLGGKTGRIASLLARRPEKLNAGEQAVMSAVNRTGFDPVLEALRNADSLGVPATLADVSPEVQSLTGAAVRRSPTVAGQARDTLIPRGRGQYDRFVSAVERDLGPVENIPQRSDDLIQQARTAAGPHYDAAYAAPGAGAVHPQIEPLLNRPSMQRALARARTIAAEEGRDPTSLGFDLDGQGNTILTQVPSWQTLDYAKRGIDDVLEGYRDGTTGRLNLDEHGRAIDNTRRQFLSIVDQANPEYAAARASYAGPAAERDALRMGQQASTMSPDQLAVNAGRATPTQMDQMRLGFQSQLAENAGRLRYSTNPFESVFGTPAMEQRLSSMYPQKTMEIARLLSQRDMERQLAASSNNLIGNSMTAERQVADEAFDQAGGWATPLVEGAIETAVMGAPWTTVARSGLGQRARDAVTLGLSRRGVQRAEQIGPIALNPDPTMTIAELLNLNQREEINRSVLDALMARGQQRGQAIGSSVSAASIPYAIGN